MCDLQNETNPAATNYGIRAVGGVAGALSTAVSVQAATCSGNGISMYSDPGVGFHVGVHVDRSTEPTARRIDDTLVTIHLGYNGAPDAIYLTPAQAQQLLDQLADITLGIELAEPAVAVA